MYRSVPPQRYLDSAFAVLVHRQRLSRCHRWSRTCRLRRSRDTCLRHGPWVSCRRAQHDGVRSMSVARSPDLALPVALAIRLVVLRAFPVVLVEAERMSLDVVRVGPDDRGALPEPEVAVVPYLGPCCRSSSAGVWSASTCPWRSMPTPTGGSTGTRSRRYRHFACRPGQRDQQDRVRWSPPEAVVVAGLEALAEVGSDRGQRVRISRWKTLEPPAARVTHAGCSRERSHVEVDSRIDVAFAAKKLSWCPGDGGAFREPRAVQSRMLSCRTAGTRTPPLRRLARFGDPRQPDADVLRRVKDAWEPRFPSRAPPVKNTHDSSAPRPCSKATAASRASRKPPDFSISTEWSTDAWCRSFGA